MRTLVLIVCLALAAGAMAEEKPKPRTVVKQVDKSSPALASTDDSADAAEAMDAKEKANKTKTRAQDYNSSRSNTTMVAGEPETDKADLGKGSSDERNKGQRGDEASGGKRKGGNKKAGARDYNSSRSNISTVAGDPDRDLDKESRCSVGRLDCDDDGDSADTREAPANHNTTRSNRTQPAEDGDDPETRKKPGNREQ